MARRSFCQLLFQTSDQIALNNQTIFQLLMHLNLLLRQKLRCWGDESTFYRFLMAAPYLCRYILNSKHYGS